MKIIKVQEDNELYEKYSTQSNPQPVYISLDLPNETLGYDINYEINATPMDVHNGMRLWFGPIPALKADKANDVIEKFQEIAQEILQNVEDFDGPSPEYKNDEIAFDLREKAQHFAEDLRFSDEEDIYQVWSFSEYFEPLSNLVELGENGLSTKSTLEDIREAAEYEIATAECPLEGDADDLAEWISEWIDREKQDEDDITIEELRDALSSYSLKSHTKENVAKAIIDGKNVYFLDSGNSGEDDFLIFDGIDSYEDIESLICYHLDIEHLPDDWNIEKVTIESFRP